MSAEPPTAPDALEAVIVVHGLWMRALAMAPLRRRLFRCGYAAQAFSYPSVREPLGANAARLQRHAAAVRAPVVHWVGHSLGGLLILRLFQDHPDQRPGRVVLLGPPARGSQVARRLAAHGYGRLLLGRSTEQALLAEGPDWRADRALGVIAGSAGLGVGCLIGAPPAPHDGTVSVQETHVPGMTDHLVVPSTHTGLLLSVRVAAQVCTFLASGCFEHAAVSTSR